MGRMSELSGEIEGLARPLAEQPADVDHTRNSSLPVAVAWISGFGFFALSMLCIILHGAK